MDSKNEKMNRMRKNILLGVLIGAVLSKKGCLLRTL